MWLVMLGSTVRKEVVEDIPTQEPIGLQALKPHVITGDIGQYQQLDTWGDKKWFIKETKQSNVIVKSFHFASNLNVWDNCLVLFPKIEQPTDNSSMSRHLCVSETIKHGQRVRQMVSRLHLVGSDEGLVDCYFWQILDTHFHHHFILKVCSMYAVIF